MQPENYNTSHFYHIFWFIVGLCSFGAGFTVFLIIYLPQPVSERIADTALIFWLSTAVAGGIGYLLGSNAQQAKRNASETTISTPTPATDKTTLITEPQKTETDEKNI